MPSAFDYDRDDADDPDLKYIAVTREQLVRAQAGIESCVECNPDGAEVFFDFLLREVSDEKGYVDYIIPKPARCPRCNAEIHEKTLVEPVGGIERAFPQLA
jgi:hypothetical protein